MNTLTAFQRDILFVMAGLDRPHGLAIRERLDDYYPDAIHHGRLYPNLDKLAERGLVEKGKKDDRTNEYILTANGKSMVEGRLQWQKAQVEQEATA